MTDHIEDSPIKKKNRGGRPPNSIWEDINKGEAVGSGKFAASCKYCKNTWSRGEVSKLKEHLSNHCPDAPAAVVRRYMSKVMERQDKSKSSKKRKYSEGQSNMDDYHYSTELNEQRCTRINRALVKFFIACGIAFRVVEHLFFINFIKELNAEYNTPTREVLVNQLLECELAQVNFKVNSELEKEMNLTLAFNGWTSSTHRSIWNFIVMTPSRKEYLYQLSDLSENSHTAEYLVTVIEKVIEESDVLPRIASYLFAICPNSATCERGFSTLRWLFHKRRLNLNVDKLESMCKLILYWKSNSKIELGFYGIDQKKNTRLSDDEINIHIAEAFAEDDDEEYNEEQASTQRLTTSGETIPEDNCRVVIESLWIDQFVNLSHDSITSEIGDIPRNILDDSNENNAEDDEVDDSGNNKRPGEGDYDYDIDDVLVNPIRINSNIM
ncbi:ribonuclease H-like domain-containing protein [Rhizophagus irregularis DAOM 181602=DAOM 197198]|nr:ribonuclease H-like domain-containing protein [Rhizophagus irregularis DAOM 181602=DAOM 197198]